MGLRETINNNSAVATSATVALLIVALGIVVWQMGIGSSSPAVGSNLESGWYYDTQTKTFFKSDSGLDSPIQSPAGNESFRAIVFSCTDSCDSIEGLTVQQIEEKGMFVSRLERLTAAGKQQYEQIKAKNDPEETLVWMSEEAGESTEISEVGATRWHPADSQQAQNIYRKMTQRCGSNRPVICRP